MNTLTELLMTDLHDMRITELHAGADARRLAAEARGTEPTPAGWSFRNVFRWPLFRRSAPRPL
jgi:hypothetical protein